MEKGELQARAELHDNIDMGTDNVMNEGLQMMKDEMGFGAYYSFAIYTENQVSITTYISDVQHILLLTRP